MIEYKKKILANGLTVVVNRDPVSKLAAVNILYKVGARNENPERTGFAHLFEHLMFRGTRRIPNFDLPVQMACGDNNAFTNNDYTDFTSPCRKTTSRRPCGSKATAWRA
ncbi:MAG: M16 family metallopeptidase [Alistipes finegoldii]